MYEEARYRDCAAQRERSDYAKNFELGIAEDRYNPREVDVTRQIPQYIAHPSDPTCPSIGSFLLVSRRIVDDKSSSSCLDYERSLSNAGL